MVRFVSKDATKSLPVMEQCFEINRQQVEMLRSDGCAHVLACCYTAGLDVFVGIFFVTIASLNE